MYHENLLEQPIQQKNIFSKSSHKIPKQSQTHPRTRYFVLTLFCNLFDGDKNVKTWVSIQSKKKNTSYNNLWIRHHFILSFFFLLQIPLNLQSHLIHIIIFISLKWTLELFRNIKKNIRKKMTEFCHLENKNLWDKQKDSFEKYTHNIKKIHLLLYLDMFLEIIANIF